MICCVQGHETCPIINLFKVLVVAPLIRKRSPWNYSMLLLFWPLWGTHLVILWALQVLGVLGVQRKMCLIENKHNWQLQCVYRHAKQTRPCLRNTVISTIGCDYSRVCVDARTKTRLWHVTGPEWTQLLDSVLFGKRCQPELGTKLPGSPFSPLGPGLP